MWAKLTNQMRDGGYRPDALVAGFLRSINRRGILIIFEPNGYVGAGLQNEVFLRSGRTQGHQIHLSFFATEHLVHEQGGQPPRNGHATIAQVLQAEEAALAALQGSPPVHRAVSWELRNEDTETIHYVPESENSTVCSELPHGGASRTGSVGFLGREEGSVGSPRSVEGLGVRQVSSDSDSGVIVFSPSFQGSGVHVLSVSSSASASAPGSSAVGDAAALIPCGPYPLLQPLPQPPFFSPSALVQFSAQHNPAAPTATKQAEEGVGEGEGGVGELGLDTGTPIADAQHT